MPLRRTIAAACLAATMLTPLTAFAHDGPSDDVSSDISRRLADPGAQAGVAVALTALSESLLNMKIEPLRRALAAVGSEGAADLPPDARLRDVTPGADRLPGEIGRRVPQAMGAAAGMAGAVEDMLPELRATVDRMKQALPTP